jgi:pimeloyl-ACP methyl ester carboxylesterase
LLLSTLSRRRFESWARGHGFYDKAHVEAWAARRTDEARSQALHGAGIAALSGALDAPWAEAWRDDEAPALLVWGRHAPGDLWGGGIEAAPELLALRPDARLEVVDATLLWPHAERAEAFVAAVEKWRKSVERAG